MKIHPVGHDHRAHAFKFDSKAVQKQAGGTTPSQKMQMAEHTESVLGDSLDTGGSRELGDQEGKLRGVIRNLQAGHYRGVADVRLRINFFDELSARSSQQAQSTALAESATFTANVNAQVDQLVSSLGIENEDQLAQVATSLSSFEAAVDQVTADFSGQGSEAVQSLQDVIQLAFNGLVDQLGQILNPDTTPPSKTKDGAESEEPEVSSESMTAPQGEALSSPTDQLAPFSPSGGAGTLDSPDVIDGLETTPSDSFGALFASAIETLIGGFDAAIADFSGSVQAASQLADPAPSSGHGSAYSKFLAIYDKLRGVGDHGVDELG